MIEKKKVCKDCGMLTVEKKCPNCGSQHLMDKYKGRVIVLDEAKSEVAKKLKITQKGAYALKY